MKEAGRSTLHRARAWRRLLAAVALAGPLMAALLVQAGADQWRGVGLILLLEPAFVGLGLYLALILAARRQWSAALGLALGGAAGLALIHAPMAPLEPPALSIPWADKVDDCDARPKTRPAPIRVLTWHAAGETVSDADVARLADLEPDLAVLTGLSGISPLERLNERRPGEFHAVGPPGDLLGIWARGIFLECQGANALWTLTVGRDGGTPVLPDESDGPGGGPARSGAGTMVLALPRVQAVGVVPLLAFVVPTATSDLASAEWPLSTVAGARALASAAMIGDADLVAAGHIAVLPGMGRITAVLDGAGLHDAGGPPTWPGRIGSWPFLAQFRLERVLAGAHWRTARTRSGAMDGAHRALLVELEPAGADDSPPGDARRD